MYRMSGRFIKTCRYSSKHVGIPITIDFEEEDDEE